tara:strand:+ start:922 stop:1080 length:159 start_codon:yes stop_codon:yes gene_type:complete
MDVTLEMVSGVAKLKADVDASLSLKLRQLVSVLKINGNEQQERQTYYYSYMV